MDNLELGIREIISRQMDKAADVWRSKLKDANKERDMYQEGWKKEKEKLMDLEIKLEAAELLIQRFKEAWERLEDISRAEYVGQELLDYIIETNLVHASEDGLCIWSANTQEQLGMKAMMLVRGYEWKNEKINERELIMDSETKTSAIRTALNENEKLITELNEKLSNLENRLRPILILNDKATPQETGQVDCDRCDIDRAITDSNNRLRNAISQITEIISELQI